VGQIAVVWVARLCCTNRQRAGNVRCTVAQSSNVVDYLILQNNATHYCQVSYHDMRNDGANDYYYGTTTNGTKYIIKAKTHVIGDCLLPKGFCFLNKIINLYQLKNLFEKNKI